MRLSKTVLGFAVLTTVLSSLSTIGGVASAAPSDNGITYLNERVCSTPAAGDATCFAIRREAVPAGKGSGGGHKPGGSTPPPVSYDAAQLQSAYQVGRLTGGTSVTVAIVDAYDAPNAFDDLTTYRSHNSLPVMSRCLTGSTGTPCFSKVNQDGQSSPLPTANSGWAQEISLDTQMVSAICPNCNILLVEANSDSFDDLATAVDLAASQSGVVAISNSYGGNEWSGETGTADNYKHPGIAITAAAGDNGYGASFPAAASTVIAVGGTSLRQASSDTWSETVWSGTGSGCSAYIAKPTWQSDRGCMNRTIGDVAADADPNTGVQVIYNGAQTVFGGTSVATPIIAAMYGLVGQGASNASSFYSAPSGSLFDVTSGSNGSCAGHGKNIDSTLVYLCNGVTGYDGPTGMGTPLGDGAFG